MEIKKYYIAAYAKALLEEDEKDEHEEDEEDEDDEDDISIFENITFYEKRFYLAHIKESTHEKYEPEELLFLAKENEFDETPDYHIKLDEGEWIENVNESCVVCIDPETNEEVDGIEYLEKNGLYYFLAETGIIKYSIWHNKDCI